MKKITLMLLVLVLSISVGLSIEISSFAEANEIDTICSQKTATDAPCGVSIHQYVDDFKENFKNRYTYTFGQYSNNSIERGQYFQNNSEIHGGNYTIYDTTVFGNDLITDFIPEELFKTAGEKFFMGKGYGFFIKTRSVNASIKKLYSTVVLFDTMGDILEDYKVSLKIAPLMKMNYIYITDSDVYQISNWEDGTFYRNGGRLTFNNGITEAIIPLVVFNEWADSISNTYKHRSYVYQEPKDFQISNISFGASIYNGNALNSFDEDYQIDDDYGYFFIGNEYEFNVKKVVKEEVLPTLLNLGDTVFSACIGAINKKFGKIGDVISTVGNIIKVGETLDACITGMTYNVTNKNAYYPSVHNYNTRATQKEKYGKLLKTSAIVLNTAGENELFFESEDYAKGTYLISHTDKANNKKEYSRLDVNIALKIKDRTSETAYKSNTVSYDLSAPETHEMKAIGQTGYYMLPMAQMNFSVVPQYNGTYTFDIGTSGIDLYINDTKRTLDSNKYTIDMLAGNTYSVSLRNTTDNKRVGKIDVDCSDFIGEKTLAGNEARLFRFVDDSEKICLLTTNNENVKFSSQFDADFNLLVGFLDTYEYSTRVTDGKTYFLVTNSANTQQSFVGEKKTEEQLTSGGNIDLSANEHNAIYKYTSSVAGDYVFTLTYGVEGDKIGARFIDEAGNNLPHSVIVEDAYRQYIVTLGENQTIRVLLFKDPETSSDVSERIDISIMNPTVWYADGVELPSTIVDVRRGQRVRLEMKVAEEKRVLLGSVSADQFGDICYASGGYIYVRNTARIGIVNLALVRHCTRYDESGETSQADIISYIRLNVILEDIASEIDTFNDNSGIGLSIANGKVDSVKIRVTYGSSYKDLEISGGRTLLNNTFSYSPTPLTLSVRIMFVKYTYIENNTIEVGQINAGTHGLAEMNFTLNPLFAEGSTQDEYKINCARHFKNISKDTRKTYRIIEDIDFNGETLSSISSFSGRLSGDRHFLNNLKITTNGTSYCGLFGTVSGTISYLTVKKVSINISGSGNLYVGIVAGRLTSDGFVYDCRISERNSLTVSAGGSAVVGGFIGWLYGGQIRNTYFGGNVTANGAGAVEVGGLIGRNSSGTVYASWSSGSVKGTSSVDSNKVYCGGLIGRMVNNTSAANRYPETMHCYSTATANGEATGGSSYVYTGGLVGILRNGILMYGYATGSAIAKNQNGTAAAGGIAGNIESCTDGRWVDSVFSTGNVYAFGKKSALFVPGESYYGYFTGLEKDNSFTNIYYSKEATMQCNSGGKEKKWNSTSWYTGKTTAQLKSVSFQKNELGLVLSFWNFVEGEYPKLSCWCSWHQS